MSNLSSRQFIHEFMLRRFKEVCLSELPTYHFPVIPMENFKQRDRDESPEFFVMIKPSGLIKEPEIKRLLHSENLVISREAVLHRFFDIANHIFQIHKIHDYRHGLPEGLIWLKLLEIFYPAHCQTLKMIYVENGDENILKRVKRKIRRTIGVEFYRVKIGQVSMITCMTPVHTSDLKNLEFESSIVDYFMNLENDEMNKIRS